MSVCERDERAIGRQTYRDREAEAETEAAKDIHTDAMQQIKRGWRCIRCN